MSLLRSHAGAESIASDLREVRAAALCALLWWNGMHMVWHAESAPIELIENRQSTRYTYIFSKLFFDFCFASAIHPVDIEWTHIYSCMRVNNCVFPNHFVELESH